MWSLGEVRGMHRIGSASRKNDVVQGSKRVSAVVGCLVSESTQP